MKVLLLSRPGDFGVLEEVWEDHPLTLPVWGTPLFQWFDQYFRSLGATELRLVCLDGPHLSDKSEALAQLLKASAPPLALEGKWSIRSALPRHVTEVLTQQRLFWQGEETLVWSAPALPLEAILGARPPSGFPEPSESTRPWLLDTEQRLTPWTASVTASLAGPRDFFQTHMQLLSVAPPRSTPLNGVDAKAVLTPPLALAGEIHAKATSRVGPHALLCPGVRLDPQTNLSHVVVLQPVRIGKGFQLDSQIIIGNTLIGPEGSLTVITDQHLLKSLRSSPPHGVFDARGPRGQEPPEKSAGAGFRAKKTPGFPVREG